MIRLIPSSLWWAKARRALRVWWRIWWEMNLGPLTDSSARLTLLLTIGIFYAAFWAGFPRFLKEYSDFWAGIEPTLWAIPVLWVWNGVIAGFKAGKDLNQMGVWRGAKFVLRNPIEVCTTSVTSANNGKPERFSVAKVYAPPGSLVEFTTEIRKRRDHLVRALIAAHPAEKIVSWNGVVRETQQCFRMSKDGCYYLHSIAAEQADPTTIQVYVASFEVQCGSRTQ